MRPKYWFWIWKTFLGPSRLRRKFVRALVFAGCIPLLLMSVVSFYLVNLTHKIDVATIEQSVAGQSASEIERFIENTLISLELTVAFSEFAPIAFEEQGFLLESFLGSNPALQNLSFICLTPAFCTPGEETSRYERQENTITKNSELRNVSQSEAFLTAKNGTRFIGQSYLHEGRVLIPIAAPVANKNAEIIAVLSGEIDTRPVQRIVNGSPLGKNGYVFVVDAANTIIAHPLPGLLGKSANHLPTLQEFQKNSSYLNADNVAVTGAQASVGKDLGWRVIAEWPEKETRELVLAIFIQILGFSLLTLLIITGVATYLAMRLIKPIAELTQGTNVIGSGNFNYRVHIKTGDELEDLGNHLNIMAKNLKSLEELKELRMKTNLLTDNLKKEQELSKLKDQFITTVSHQFNTPLSVIKWAIASLQDPNTDPETRAKSIEVIVKSQNDISSILSDLITITQIGFNYEKENVTPTNIADIIKKILVYMHDIAEVKKITLNFRDSTNDPLARANAFTTEKALENLIDNAIGYSHDGTTIEMELLEKNKELIFKITDYGIGIPDSDKDSIFQEFFRAKNAVEKKNVGTGLGLFIVKRIADGHNGKVWFESNEGKGSTFYLSIPRE